MMLVHKQPSLPMSTPYSHHRRYPSAPSSVVVQPTRTPGLLSLSKPAQHILSPRQRTSPRVSKQQITAVPPQHARPAVASQILKPPVEINEKKAFPSLPTSLKTPERQVRGRQPSKQKEKSPPRSTSHSSVRVHRNHGHQPSPADPSLSSQSETNPSTPPQPKTSYFDPFLVDDNVTSRSSLVTSAPTLAVRPTGRLARRRQHDGPTPANSPSKPIPVPRRQHSLPISRSDSEVHDLPLRVKKERNLFPICDDLTEVGDLSDDESNLVTPLRKQEIRSFFDNGPMTAPLVRHPAQFPFSSTPSPSPSSNVRRHRRAPSEGLFNMSSDDDMSASAIQLKNLIGQPRKHVTRSLPADDSDFDVEPFFASSTFQNSPSPEELPPPAF